MTRNFNRYQYETSPRKLEPEYTPIQNPYKRKKTTARKTKSDIKRKKVKEAEVKKKKRRTIKYLAIGFLILFGISYRNSQIDESFAKIQSLKAEIANAKKQNAQLEISIENGQNLNNLEQEAKEKLGMQKLNTKQTRYITLPKNDYIEPASEKVIIDEENTGVKGILDKIMNIFK